MSAAVRSNEFLSFLSPHRFCFLSSPAESVVQEPPHAPYSPFILVSNLRAHLYVALEKNAWLQKRIEELEEERNFLRCQLDRFIISMRSQEGEATGNLRLPRHRKPSSYYCYCLQQQIGVETLSVV